MRTLLALAVPLLFMGSLAAVAPPTTTDGAAWPTPEIACQLADVTTDVRIVPEPETTNDYISFDEGVACLEAIQGVAPDYVELRSIGQSAGWDVVTGGHQSYDVWLVEVTNEKSSVPFDAKLKHVFQLSVHGNEKGGREGGLRVIEDLARCLDAAGAITSEHPELCGYLDYMVAVFTFPNPDGWVHEEAEVFAANPSTGFTRGNGNGYDLNRQWPNRGWNNEAHQALSQPEIQASLAALTNYTNVATATDIHGMLNPTDADPFGEASAFPEDQDYAPGGSLLEGLLDAGQADPLKMFKTTRLAELLKERVNNDPELAAWNEAPATGAWGGQVMEWGTSWDTIGYVDSGFTGDFFFQNHGLNATAMDFELAYNHIVCDNHYAGCGHATNKLHTRLVRQIVAVFMESATRDVQVSLDTEGTRTAWLANPFYESNRNENGSLDPLDGWAAENPADDAYDYANVDYAVDGDRYFEVLKPFVTDGDQPGVLDRLTAAQVRAGDLDDYDRFVVGGSAYGTLDEPALQALAGWVRGGGVLVVTDQALQFLPETGLVNPNDIQSVQAYAGHTDIQDRTHALAAGLRGIARQTYEAVPLGYQPGTAPIWGFVPAAITEIDGTVVGTAAPGGASAIANFGEVPVGDGTVRFLGALLPDPTEEFYHPYGLDSYATTYTGNQLLRNMLGWSTVFAEPPVVVENLGQDRPVPGDADGKTTGTASGADSPGLGFAALLAAAALAAAAMRRRR